MSEGRIHSDGTLMCSYHGWRFRGDGACVDIPQSLDAKANATARASPRSCIKAHPVKVCAQSPLISSLAPLCTGKLAAVRCAAQRCRGMICLSTCATPCCEVPGADWIQKGENLSEM